MAKRALKEAKPIEDMLKAELVVEVNARIKEVAMLKELITAMASTPQQPVQARTTRWKTYGRCSS